MRGYLLLVGMTVFLSRFAGAQEFASGSYAELRRSLEPTFQNAPAIRELNVRLLVRTSNPDARPGDLRLWLDVGGTQTELDIAEDGSLTLPRLDEELASLAWIRSNQPKGTLTFTTVYELNLRPPRGRHIENALVIRYDDLFAANQLAQSAGEEFDAVKPGQNARMKLQQLQAMIFTLDHPEQPSRVAIRTGDATIDIRPFRGKSYRIPFKDSLLADPSVIVLVPQAGWKLKAEWTQTVQSADKRESGSTR